MIPYGRQKISASDIEAVLEVLRSPYLTQGPRVELFEKALASKLAVSHAVAVNSATSALHLACLALGVGNHDLVWTSAISFVASANAARYCGAEVDFVDIDPDTFNMSVDALAEKLSAARRSGGKLPKVVIPVDMAGQSADMSGIADLANEFGFKIIEDASHALGGSYRGISVGCCAFSDVTVFSFHPVKMITTGEGGACVTNNSDLANKIRRLRSHGITRDPSEMANVPDGPWYYEQLDLGFNYRITDIQCALGASQLERLDDFVEERNQISAKYGDLLERFEWLKLPHVDMDARSSFHLYIVQVDESAPSTRNRYFEAFRSSGILVNLHYIPIYRHPYYSAMQKFRPEEFPAAENYYKSAISLPIFPGLSDAQLDQIASVFSSSFGHQILF